MSWKDRVASARRTLDQVAEQVRDAAEQVKDQVQSMQSDPGAAPSGPPPSPGALADAAGQIPTVAAHTFPDDAGAAWTVTGTWARGSLALVTGTAVPSVGYDEITFAFTTRGEAAAFTGTTYIRDGAGWAMLAGDAALPARLPAGPGA